MTVSVCARALLTLALTAALLAGCGGGGGSNAGTSTASPAPNSIGSGGGNAGAGSDGAGSDSGGSDGGAGNGNGNGDPAAPPALRGLFGASRLASRATFGADLAGISHIQASGEEAWLEQQFALPLSSHDAVVEALLARQARGDFDAVLEDRDAIDFSAFFGRAAWWHTTVTAPDQLRQRVAYALSQIFVISDEVNTLFIPAFATSNYYDMLLTHSFGNFGDLLLAVTLHPSMGVYLSHLNNARGNPERGTFPDENYAREVMQLFSIGLFELNPDGTERLDEQGEPIPTYDNDDIREFARVFTGLSWGGLNPRFGTDNYNFRQPMRMFDDFHEPGEKSLLRGESLPAGQGGMADIRGAVGNLFRHPNVGPFIGRQLIQRLVTSNPSPAYVARVAAAFDDDGSGVRGDMKTVLRAILLDPEALALPDESGTMGKLREPVLRYTAMLRQLGLVLPDGFYANLGFLLQERVRQHPLSAPSVFNFYLPDHQPIGDIATAQLLAPEFQITNSNSVVEISNLMQIAVLGDYVNDLREAPFSAASLSFDDYLPLAADVDALLERLDTVLTYGTLGDDTRASIRELCAQIDELPLRVRVAAYLVLISPDYVIEL